MVTKIMAKKKPPGPKMVTKIMPAGSKKPSKQSLDSMKITFACNFCENVEFDSKEKFKKHQEEFHSLENE